MSPFDAPRQAQVRGECSYGTCRSSQPRRRRKGEREREKERERERDPHRETVFRKPKISILREREREREFNQETMSITGVSRARPGDRP